MLQLMKHKRQTINPKPVRNRARERGNLYNVRPEDFTRRQPIPLMPSFGRKGLLHPVIKSESNYTRPYAARMIQRTQRKKKEHQSVPRRALMRNIKNGKPNNKKTTLKSMTPKTEALIKARRSLKNSGLPREIIDKIARQMVRNKPVYRNR